MPRTMYDSVTPSAIPRSAQMVAGYLPPSRYAWSAAEWAMFPRAVKVRIAIFANVNDGHVLDVEPGDATPAQAPGWVVMRRRAGVDPSVYCNASTWPTVRAEFRRRGIREPHYWIAKYDGVARLPAGAVAKQYADPPLHGRGHFDLSIVADRWPGVDEEDVMTPHQYRVLVETQRRVSRTYAVVVENQRRIAASQAAILAAINSDNTSTPEMTRILDEKVAEHMPSSEEIVAAQRMLLADVVREVVPGEQADVIVEKLNEKLAEIGEDVELPPAPDAEAEPADPETEAEKADAAEK
jgi:hypothetical protein